MLTASGLLFAVHIADNILDAWCWGGGLLVTAVLAVIGAWRIRDEEIPRVALITSAFFVATAIHIPVWPTSIHLLLNGLVGVLLGWRACLAIPMGILLHYLLIQHGGFYTVGVNSCVQLVPALAAYYGFTILRHVPWLRAAWFRSSLIGACSLVALLSIVYSVVLLWTNFLDRRDSLDLTQANALTFHPVSLVLIALVSGLIAWAQHRLRYAPEFALGLLLGELTVLGTVALNNIVLLWGGESNWRDPALILLVGSVPLAVIEGLVVGFTVAFLVRVKPELLGDSYVSPSLDVSAQAAIGVSPSSNGLVRSPMHAASLDSAAPPCPAPEPAVDAGHRTESLRPSA